MYIELQTASITILNDSSSFVEPQTFLSGTLVCILIYNDYIPLPVQPDRLPGIVLPDPHSRCQRNPVVSLSTPRIAHGFLRIDGHVSVPSLT